MLKVVILLGLLALSASVPIREKRQAPMAAQFRGAPVPPVAAAPGFGVPPVPVPGFPGVMPGLPFGMPGMGGVGGPLLPMGLGGPAPGLMSGFGGVMGPGFGGLGTTDPLGAIYGGPFRGPFAEPNGGPWAGPFRSNGNSVDRGAGRFRG